MDTALHKLKQALNKNELREYLMGGNGYRFNDPWTEAPTDLSTIFIQGFNEYIKESNANKQNLEEELSKAFYELLKTTEGTWWTVSILYSYLYGFKKDALKFSIDIPTLVPLINISLTNFKELLKIKKDWVGWRFENGLWDDINFMRSKINEIIERDHLRIESK